MTTEQQGYTQGQNVRSAQGGQFQGGIPQQRGFYNIEIEQSIFASVLLDNESTIGMFIKLKAEDFYSPSHRIIFTAMKEIIDNNGPADFVTVVSALDKKGELENVGGVEYIATLNGMLPSAVNFKSYVREFDGLRLMRQIIKSANSIIEEANKTGDATKTLQFAEGAIFGIAKESENTELTLIGNELPAVMEQLMEIQKNPAGRQGVKSGFWGLDKMTNGFKPGDLVIIAARPSVGKTAMGLNMVLHAAVNEGTKCAVFSLEMSKQQLAMRALTSLARVSMEKASKGEMSMEEWGRINVAYKKLMKAKIYVDDTSTITPAGIRNKCMTVQRTDGLELIMIDYLGLMTGGGRRESRQVEVSDNSRNIKIMAKELGVPVLLLSQLNRGVEARKGEEAKPMLSDLRESGAIEQDADIVMFIHREKTEEGEGPPREVELIVAKHRAGPLGNVKLGWAGEYTTFLNKREDAAAASAASQNTTGNSTSGSASRDEVGASQPNAQEPEFSFTVTKEEIGEPKPIAESGLLDIF